jgi:hypothetical protein
LVDVLLTVGSILGLLGSLASLLLARRTATDTPAASQPPTIRDRIDQLRENLGTSRSLIEEITAEMDVQVAALERIRAEAEENQRLAALNQDEADAVRKLVETTIQSAHGRSTAAGKRQQRWYFVAGLCLAIPLGVAGNFIYAWLA